MATQFAPEFLFTDPVMANQMVRLADLNAAHKNEQQRTALAVMEAARNRQAQEQNQQNQLAYHYAQLANQQQAQNAALASQEKMFGQQQALTRELAQLNPYGRNAGDIYLGGMAQAGQVDESNNLAEIESRNKNAALTSIHQKYLTDYHNAADNVNKLRYLTGNLPGVDTYDMALQRTRQEITNKYLSDRATLAASALHSYFDPEANSFVAAKRALPGMPGRMTATTATPAAAPAVAVPPRSSALISPTMGLDYGASGEPPPTAGELGEASGLGQAISRGFKKMVTGALVPQRLSKQEQFARLKALYGSGQISDSDFTTQYDLINQGP